MKYLVKNNLILLVLTFVFVQQIASAYDNNSLIMVKKNNEKETKNYNQVLVKNYNKRILMQKIEKEQINLTNNLSIADVYYTKKDYRLAAKYYEKAALEHPNSSKIYEALSNCYDLIKDHKNALKNYEIFLKLNKTAMNNAQIFTLNKFKFLVKEDNIFLNLNSLKISEKAPQTLYSLVCFDPKVTESTKNKTYEILDYIWSDPEGQILLDNLISNQIKIYILHGESVAHTDFTYNNDYIVIDDRIKIWDDTVKNFKNSLMPAFYTADTLRTFITELGHAISGDNPKYKLLPDSIEEELGVNMIAKNIIYRMCGKNGISKDDAIIYSKMSLLSILSDQHKDLPVYNNFNFEAKEVYGLDIPYDEEYCNLMDVYKEIRDFDSVNKDNSLEKELLD